MELRQGKEQEMMKQYINLSLQEDIAHGGMKVSLDPLEHCGVLCKPWTHAIGQALQCG